MKLILLLPLLLSGLLFLTQSSDGVGIECVFIVRDLSKFLYKSFMKVKAFSHEKNLTSETEMEKKIFSTIASINEKFDIVDYSINHDGQITIQSVVENLEETVRAKLGINDLLDYLQNIDVYYRRMQDLKDNLENLDNNILINFVKQVVGFSQYSVIIILEKINKLVIGKGDEGDKGILKSLLDKNKNRPELTCMTRQSQQQRVYNFFSMILLTELKGEALIQYSYWILQLYQKREYKYERLIAEKTFKRRINSAMLSIKEFSKDATRDLWICDPDDSNYKQGKTYEEITRLIQGYVQNEIDMSDSESCWKTCNYYKLTKSRNKCYNKQNYCERRGCNGKILNCQFIESDMQICPSDPKSNRRYDYIKYESGKRLGTVQTCNGSVQNVEAWWRVVVHCSYCICLCDEADRASDRYFNLGSSVSNITENKVVVGVRFVKKNRIIHLQVQEGKLGPYGKIYSNTLRWVPVDNYQIINANIKEGKDFHTLTLNKRSVALDDVIVERNNTITGVRFDVVDSILTLKVRMTPFNFKKGILDAPKSEWVGNNIKKREELKLFKPDVPTKTKYGSLPDSKTGQFIQFTHSDLQKDVAQTTVPFIDIQNVESRQPAPLDGIGIYHKGRRGYGGFIATRISTYDVTDFIQTPFVKYKRKNVN